MTATVETPESHYTTQSARFATERDELQARSNRQANISLLLITLAVLGAGYGLWTATAWAIWLGGAFFLAFLVSYTINGRLNRALQRATLLWEINDEGLRRLRRDWKTLPLRQAPGSIPPHPYAGDLDLLGHASLQHLLNTAQTPIGQVTLRDWLLTPASPDVARQRQQAVAELAPQTELRDELNLRGRKMQGIQQDYERFLNWASATPWLPQHPWLLWLARSLVFLNIGLVIAVLAGLPLMPLLGVSLLIGSVLTVTTSHQIDAIIDQVADRQSVFASYATLFALIAEQPFSAPELQRLQATLTANGQRADMMMRRLARLMPPADLRKWMFFFIVQVSTLWNVHLLWLLERWQREAGAQTREWLAALGELEALIALATLKYDQPTWCFPELERRDSHPPMLEATALGHPLLAPDVRVDNDITVGPPGTFLLVTGSNMSGKSTLLRALGTNIVLAQAGGPVCATAMRLPPLQLSTSIRIQDSLEQGVSYFMAELLRLRDVVRTADAVQAAGERTLFYLLDEILHGTNTAERQIAARRVIRHLIDSGAIGAVSTHDLTLADSPELADATQNVHFRESFSRGADGPHMDFDYVMRPGPATSTNALKLMEVLDLLPEDEQAALQ